MKNYFRNIFGMASDSIAGFSGVGGNKRQSVKLVSLWSRVSEGGYKDTMMCSWYPGIARDTGTQNSGARSFRPLNLYVKHYCRAVPG